MPGSPEISTTCPSPAFARSQRREQQLELLLAADQRGRAAAPWSASNRLSARTLAVRPARPARARRSPFSSTAPRSAKLEKAAHQSARACGDHDSAWARQRLQPGREVGRLADDRLLLGRTLADEIAYDDQPGGDTDPRRPAARRRQSLGCPPRRDGEPRPDRSLGLVLVRLGQPK